MLSSLWCTSLLSVAFIFHWWLYCACSVTIMTDNRCNYGTALNCPWCGQQWTHWRAASTQNSSWRACRGQIVKVDSQEKMIWETDIWCHLQTIVVWSAVHIEEGHLWSKISMVKANFLLWILSGSALAVQCWNLWSHNADKIWHAIS